MIRFLCVLCIILISCKEEPYRYRIDARYPTVFIEANGIIKANGLKIELVPSTISDIKFYDGLCNGATGLEHNCFLNICNTKTRTPKQMARTLLHEIGHCVGLNHIDDKTNIMYFQNIESAVKFNKEQIDKVNKGT